MNYKMVGRFMFLIIITEAIFMVPAWLISLVSGEDASASAFAITIVGAMVVGLLGLMWCRKAERHFYAREGLVMRFCQKCERFVPPGLQLSAPSHD